MSMDVNLVEKFNISSIEDIVSLDVMDIPGQGFFKTKILDTLPNAKTIIVFIDSTDKESITRAADYLYDVINSEYFDEFTPIIIACNKQDLKFPKTKKIIESDLNNEIENVKQIKQKNNLEETSQMGTLFSMRTKFNFNMFKNIQFVETDKTNGYESLINLLKSSI
jgi:signal recognition particle receptor subunit beta